MKKHARKAFNQMRKVGATLFDREEYGSHFIISAELQTAHDVPMADSYGEYIKEYVDEEGVIHNAFGIVDSLHRIAEENDLILEWVNPGMVGVYDA